MSDSSKSKGPDAGTRSIDHYKSRLSPWRYRLRHSLIAIIRWETPVLARLQRDWRTSALDAYFASAANLGTHTFFMIILPVLFWCGRTTMGRAMVNMLAAGVFLSGFMKDLFCLPRPMSPPLQRISKSTSAALEYGFPSTHSTNAVSVAVYFIYALRTSSASLPPFISGALHVFSILYVTSIIVGRLYCGMHGFFDVVVGSLLGLLIAAVQCVYGEAFDDWIAMGPFTNVVIAVLCMLILVRVHPEPVDDCPCYDDSVSFSGVFIGCQFAQWHFARTPYSWDQPVPSTVPFDARQLGFPRIFVRIFIGVLLIFIWRGGMKPFLLRSLPPVFRFVEKLGLLLPRRYFLNASEYGRIPTLRKDDNIIPPASEIPQMLKSLRHPRERTISVGPQSEADAYEAIAYRERRRRASTASQPFSPVNEDLHEDSDGDTGNTKVLRWQRASAARGSSSALERPHISFPKADLANLSTQNPALLTPALSSPGIESPMEVFPPFEMPDEAEDRKADAEMFLALLKPRVRYDVEVVTKLIVYAGIGWLATEGGPILYQISGLGL